MYNCSLNNFVDHEAAWELILGYLEKLYIKFDPSHSFYAGRDYLAETKNWGHRFAHVHIKGALKVGGVQFDDPPAGLDQIDWKSFMATLYTVGYNGNLSIEPHSSIWKDELGDKGIEYTIRFIKDLIV